METITSVHNPKVKQLLSLRERRHRDRLGLVLVDGAQALRRALDSGLAVPQTFICPEILKDAQILPLCHEHGIEVIALAEPAYSKAAYGDWADGVLATVAAPKLALDQLRLSHPALIMVAVQLEKPGNLGAIIRSADGAGVDAVIIADAGCDPFSPNVVRASLGTVFTMPLAAATTTQVIHWLAQRNIDVIAATPEADALAWEVDLTGPCGLVVGSEHQGVAFAWRQAAKHQLRLPMLGHADSLNVGTAAAILMYEARRQRELPSTPPMRWS